MTKQKILAYLRLMRFHQPIGIFLLLWPTLWALWVAAQGVPKIWNLCVFIIGVILLRAAGCIINDIVDRHWDGQVTRTRQRPLVTGEVSLRGALILFGVLIICAFLLVLTLNLLTIGLAPIAVLLAAIYPFLKRVTHWPQIGLGIAFSFSVPMAFAAETGQISLSGWWLFLCTVLWTIAYDTQYAMMDREDDIKVGIKSTAILFARYDCLIIGLIQLIMLMLLALLGVWLAWSIWFYVSLFLVLLLMIYQQQLMYNRKPEGCFRAFLNNHWVGLVIFCGIALSHI